MIEEFLLACLFNILSLIIILSALTVGSANDRIQVNRCHGFKVAVVAERYVYPYYGSRITLLTPANCDDEDTTGVIELTSIPNITSYLHLELERFEIKWNQADGQPLVLNNLKSLELTNCKLNPHSVQFTGKLIYLKMTDSRLVDGTLEDLLKTASGIENLKISGMWYENEIEERPIFIKSLKRLYLTGGWSEDNHNPLPFLFSESLRYLWLKKMNVTFGNFRTLLQSATKLRESVLNSVQLISDNLETKLVGLDNVAEFTGSQMSPNSTAFGERLDYFQRWNGQPLLLDLQTLELTNCTLNPPAIQFTEKLKYLKMNDSRLINGTLEDLLKTASGIERLEISGMWYKNEMEDRPIYLKSLKWFEFRAVWSEGNHNPLPFVCSESLYFLRLEGMNVTVRNLKSLLQSATELREFKLYSVQLISDNLETKPVGLGNVSEFSGNQMNPNSISFRERLDNFQKWNGQPILLNNMRTIELTNCKLNPISIQFTGKLITLQMTDSRLINGTLEDLLKTASGIEQLRLEGMWYENEIEDRTIFLRSLERFWLIGGWGKDRNNPLPFRFSESLDFLYLEGMNVTDRNLQGLLHSATKLRTVALGSVQVRSDSSGTKRLGVDYLANGLLRNMSSLEKLYLTSMGEVDLSSLPSSNLTHLEIWGSKMYRSSPVLSDKPDSVSKGSTSTDNPTIFDDFDIMFPKIKYFNTGPTYLINPTALPALFRSSATELEFSFDFEPQIKTFAFGEAMKIMKNAGLKGIDDWKDPNPDRENWVRQTRARYISFRKRTTENGTDKWEQYREETKYFDETVEETKPPAWKLTIYIYILILSLQICIGIFGNITSAIILVRRKLKNSAELILLFLTFYDGLVILTYLVSLYFNAQLFFTTLVKAGRKAVEFPTDEYSWIAEQNSIQAFLVYPLNKIGYTGSVYSTVLISLERFVAICYPLKAKHLLRSRNSKMALFFIFSFSTLINLPRWIETYEWNYYSPDSPSWNEHYRPTFMRMEIYRTLYHGFLWAILMYILPFVLVGYFNFKIVQNIRISRRIRESLQQTNEASADATESSGITKVLLCVVCVFVVCNALHIGIVAYFFTKYEYIELSTIEAISCFPVIINSSVNFIIYIFLGKTLREEFMKLIPKCVKSYFDRERINKIPGAHIHMETIGCPCDNVDNR